MSFEKLAELATAADSITLHVQKITDTSFMVVIQPSLKLAEKYPQLSSLRIPAIADSDSILMADTIPR